jgi:uncharacterized membrane protein YgdD (TMEM256/DUF423 family)
MKKNVLLTVVASLMFVAVGCGGEASTGAKKEVSRKELLYSYVMTHAPKADAVSASNLDAIDEDPTMACSTEDGIEMCCHNGYCCFWDGSGSGPICG